MEWEVGRGRGAWEWLGLARVSEGLERVL